MIGKNFQKGDQMMKTILNSPKHKKMILCKMMISMIGLTYLAKNQTKK